MKELDLHGIKHENVSSALDSFFWDAMQKKETGLKIVTGNSPEMKKLVVSVIEEYGFIYEEGFLNKGCIIVNLV
jgi:DNA-nicking Smr family endonuclease